VLLGVVAVVAVITPDTSSLQHTATHSSGGHTATHSCGGGELVRAGGCNFVSSFSVGSCAFVCGSFAYVC